MKSIQDLRKLKTEDLKSKLNEMKKEMMKINMARATNAPIENPGRVRLVKKTIARINFLIHTSKINNIKKGEKEVKNKKA